MHKLERYGVVALVFLLVTILAVSLWSGSEDPAPAVAKATPGANSTQSSSQPPLSRPAPATQRSPGAGAVSPTRPAGSANARPQTATSRRPSPRPGPTSTREEAERLLAEAAARGGARSETSAGPRAQPPVRSRPVAAAETAGPLTDLIEQDGRPQERRAPVRRATPAANTGREVVVRAGDTLSEIAQRELGGASRWRDIAAANPSVDPDRLLVGTKLRIPDVRGAGSPQSVARNSAPASKPRTETAPAAAGVYVVRSGDTLSRIAARELGSADRWRQIVAANPGVDPNRLLVGAKLRLPGGPSAPSQVTVAANSRGWSSTSRWGKSGSKGRVR